jgi:hypothetical protein
MTKDISFLINVDITHPVKVKKQKDNGLTLSGFWVSTRYCNCQSVITWFVKSSFPAVKNRVGLARTETRQFKETCWWNQERNNQKCPTFLHHKSGWKRSSAAGENRNLQELNLFFPVETRYSQHVLFPLGEISHWLKLNCHVFFCKETATSTNNVSQSVERLSGCEDTRSRCFRE